jgi:uncharacterized hydantoinase/oxoprolinase family protein
MSSIGWDIGGVNVKVARVAGDEVSQALTESFSIEHDADRLSSLLERLGRDIGAKGCRHAVTMTAELSRDFAPRRKASGSCLTRSLGRFPAQSMQVLDTAGLFRTPAEARAHPIEVSASNWTATAMVVAAEHPDVILLDMGTTTTDIIPIESGRIQHWAGRTPTDSRPASWSTAVRCALPSRHSCGQCRGVAAWRSFPPTICPHRGRATAWLGT